MRNTAPATGWSNTIPAAIHSAAPAATTASFRRWTTRRTSTNWQIIERAKKRLFYSLLQLHLPLATRNEDSVHGLRFEFLSDEAAAQPVHDRPRKRHHHAGTEGGRRRRARETAHRDEGAYRTLLGHFRHEVGHYYWDLLIENQPALDRVPRAVRRRAEDYGQALQRHYENGAPADWQQNYISAYATSHPWEDWAETWAHFPPHRRHHRDGVGLRCASQSQDRRVSGELKTRIDFDPYRLDSIDELIRPLGALGVTYQQPQSRRRAARRLSVRARRRRSSTSSAFIQKIVRKAGAVQWTVPGPNGQIFINRPWLHIHDGQAHEAVDYRAIASGAIVGLLICAMPVIHFPSVADCGGADVSWTCKPKTTGSFYS